MGNWANKCHITYMENLLEICKRDIEATKMKVINKTYNLSLSDYQFDIKLQELMDQINDNGEEIISSTSNNGKIFIITKKLIEETNSINSGKTLLKG